MKTKKIITYSPDAQLPQQVKPIPTVGMVL